MPEQCLPLLQNVCKENFRNVRIKNAQRRVTDINNDENKFSIIEKEHKRAHRNHVENKTQILERFYFPQMTKLIQNYIKNCSTCATNKYDRHPIKPQLQPTPIPDYPTQILHIDIIEIQKEKFITCIDKFTKFTKFFHIKNKSVLHIRGKLVKLLHYFSMPETIVMDNEGCFIGPIVLNYIEGLGVKIYVTPAQKSEVNGAIERVHSTIIELYRCLKDQYSNFTIKELVNIVVDRYNNTIHSVTKKKPVDMFFNRTSRINYQHLLEFKEKVNDELKHEIARNQKLQLSRENKKRKAPPQYQQGDVVYKLNKQIKSKDKPLYDMEVVKENNNVSITTPTNKKIHKSHLKNV